MADKKLFNLIEGIKFLKEGKKIRKKSWRKTFSWIEYASKENCIIRYDAHGLEVKIYKDVDLDNPGKRNDMKEEVWEVYDQNFY
jgi:hypothetical protein